MTHTLENASGTQGKPAGWQEDLSGPDGKKTSSWFYAFVFFLLLMPSLSYADCPAYSESLPSVGYKTSTGDLMACNGTNWVSIGTGGSSIPVKTIGARNAMTPNTGDVIYNSTRNRVEWYNGTNWYYAGTPSVASRYYASCKAILDAGASTGSGSYTIDPQSNDTGFTAYCDMTTDGGGYTYYPVTGGIQTYGNTDNNTCKTLGMDLAVPRTKAHFSAMLTKYGSSYFSIAPGIYKTTAGGSYTNCIMRDPAAYGTGCSDWRAVDGGKWWLRDSTYTEPNGDYTASCWLLVTNSGDVNNITINDHDCDYSATNYICSTNDK